MTSPQFYSVPEVAEILRISRTTVHRLIHSEQLPAFMVGTQFRIPVKGVETYLERSVYLGRKTA